MKLAHEYDYWLDVVPEQMKTPELCLAAVQEDGWSLRYVPEHLMTPELCRIAMQHSLPLFYVPEHPNYA